MVVFKICSDIAGISNESFLLLDLILTNLPVNYFLGLLTYICIVKASRSWEEKKNEEAKKVKLSLYRNKPEERYFERQCI